ncbi:TetR/AcrR family transcriptional regulator [Cryptosporangium aurantiacum]|uniref:Transcriptional regulator, TetR family n=1 Tax=Cryptosporangium aurantiacum TaxID=134849 RepID=A0A1M7RK27_9ACTN|nr:TetR/AcrR family transcriptional regulator [Cryptosporangium aurantiacum]SHN46511.1 transcriptional regulator, TetR family [Cryptosporangium aurantiacum]
MPVSSGDERPVRRRTLGRPANADSAATRRAILAAASAELAAGGYERLSLETVADRVGITRGAIYRYFGSKLDLARNAVREASAAFDGAIEGQVYPAGGLLDQLRALVRVAANYAFEHPDRSMGYYQIGRLAPEDEEIAAAFRELSRQVRVVIVELIARAEERGELAPGVDRAAIIQAVAGLIWMVGSGAATAPNEEVRQQILHGIELFFDRPPWFTGPE